MAPRNTSYKYINTLAQGLSRWKIIECVADEFAIISL